MKIGSQIEMVVHGKEPKISLRFEKILGPRFEVSDEQTDERFHSR